MRLLLKKLHPDAKLPTRAYPTSVGWDLYAHNLDEDGRGNTILIPPRMVKKVPTGLVFGGVQPDMTFVKGTKTHAPHSKPSGPQCFATVASRSGLAEQSIFVANAPGIIDPEYRGQIMVLLYNGGHDSYYVRHGDRIAQLVIAPIFPTRLEEVQVIEDTQRGEKGFGSTGR